MKYEFKYVDYGETIIISNFQNFTSVWISPKLFLAEIANLPNYDQDTGVILKDSFYKYIHPSGNYEEMVAQLQNFMIKEML